MRAPIIALLCTLLLVGLGQSGCSPQTQPPIRLGTNIWPGYEPLYLARELGMLPEQQVRLIEYLSTSEVLRAFRNGRLDAASLTLDEALQLSQRGIPLRIILVHDISDGADVIMARPGIDSVQDLRGKRVGVESSALGAFMLTRTLQYHGMSIDDIHVRHLEVDEQELSYHEGDVDAVVTFEPVRTRLLQAGAHQIASSAELPGEIVDVLVVHEDIYRKRLPALKALVDSWFGALDHLDKQPQEAARIMAQRLKLSPEEIIASYAGLKLPDRAENRALLDGPQARLLDTMDKLESVLLQHKLLQHPVDTHGLPSGAAL